MTLPIRAAIVLPALLITNGLVMVVAGSQWYQAVPGVADLGPYNGHLVADAGIAFLAAGASFLLSLIPGGRAAALPGAVFLIGHAAFHAGSWLRRGLPASTGALVTELVGVLLPAYLAWRIVRPALPGVLAAVRAPAAAVETGIRAMERRLGVGLDYMRQVARDSPRTLDKIRRLQALAIRRAGVDPAPYHFASLGAIVFDDCGECVQIHVNLGLADGISPSALQAALDGRLGELPELLADAFRFGQALASGEDATDLRRRLRDHLGDDGLTELSFTVAGARFFPTFKRGLGVFESCSLRPVRVGGRAEVIHAGST